MMPSIKPTPPFLFDSLYCEEERWDTGSESTQGESDNSLEQKPLLDSFWEDDDDDGEELNFLLNKENENELYSGFEESSSFAEGRAEAVEWMLRVIDCYSFSALTAVLAMNYLDRFLRSLQQSYRDKAWTTQLAAVACLSLAAKVEETQVPLLLDLQVAEESKYLFESKTIQRMEILILSTLKWRMNPVTPLSFFHHIAKRLGCKGHFYQEFLKRCESLLLCVISDSRIMCHLPSALATATALYVISGLEPSIVVEHQDQLFRILGINKEKVRDCCRQIQEVAANAHFRWGSKRKLGSSLPGSPKGVMDVSFSYDWSSNDSWAVNSVNSSGSSVSSSPEPLPKKIKSWTADDIII